MTHLKILVFSDSHRSTFGMIAAIKDQRPDLVIHLGDLQRDAEELGYAYPTLALVSVPGNCDGWTTDLLEKQIQVEGVRILLSHGHVWQVKRSYDAALYAARKAKAGLLLFGHTHQALCRQEADGLWMLNPGAARSSYGIVLLDQGKISCSLASTP